jgi:O-antigen/teichoic acid export membrane protein
MLAMSNAGLTLGLINRLMDCHVNDDRALAQRYVSSLMLTLAGMVLVMIVIWTIVSASVSWGHVFKTTDPRALRAMPWVIWITGVSTLVGLVFTMPMSIYSAYQELTIAALWDGAAKIVALVVCVFIVYTRWGMIGVALATCTVPAVTYAVNTFWLFKRKPWIRPRLGCFDKRLVRSTLRDGLLLFLLQSSVLALFSCDNLIIGTVIDVGSVMQYALIGKIFIIVYGVYMALLTPMWPAHGEAIRRGDWNWVSRALRISLIAGFGLCIGCGIMLLVVGDTFFRIWTRGQITHISPNVVLAMTAMFVGRVWVDCRSVILTSANVLLPQVYFFVAHALLNLLVAVILAKHIGVAGVAWATPLTALVTSIWGYPWMMRRLFKRSAGENHQAAAV